MVRFVAPLAVLFALLPAPALAQSHVPLLHLIAANQFCAGGDGPACVVNKFGSNQDVGMNDFEVLSQTGSDHAFVFENTNFFVSSTDFDDRLAGAGAQAVMVECFDEDFSLLSEVVDLNGTTEVALIASCMLPVRLSVEAGPENSANQGTIWIGTGIFTAGVPAVKHGQIAAERGQSEMSIYASRKGYKTCLVHFTFSSDDVGEVKASVLAKSSGYVKRVARHFWVPAGFYPDSRGMLPLCLETDTILIFEAMSHSGSPDVMSIAFDLIEYKTTPDGRISSAPIH